QAGHPSSWPVPPRWERGIRQICAVFDRHLQQEICQLKWEWEYRVPELDTSVFVLPASVTKNKEERVVPLNAVSRSIIESQRGKHPSRVFTHWPGNKKRGDKALVPLQKIYNSGWKSARERAADEYEEEMKDKAHWGFRNLRVHDLRHTFGRRLRAAGVSKETRSDLLGHKTGDITTHYSAAEIKELIEAVEKITSNNLPEIYQTTLVRLVG
ncbi:MAG: tyrosine-type recombinase/integrase, partial [Candidatus Sedimenticola endophacoides]